MRTAATLLALITALVPPADPIFRFHNTFWPNLHHFLYVLGRASAGTSDAGRRAVVGAPKDLPGVALTEAERAAWTAAVATYRDGPSAKDAVFDSDLVELTGHLALAADAPSLAEASPIPPDVRDALERAAPIYRRAWWPRHRAANEARIREVTPFIDRHGAAVRDHLTRVYAQPWPAGGRTIEVSAYANWAGAYSTGSESGGVLVLSSLDPGTAGGLGFEMLFHEAMHQWDDTVDHALLAEARRQKKELPRTLSHAMIFYTAGDAVRRQIPGHVTYAEANGMWKNGPFARYKVALDEVWLPWLDGKTTRAAALAAIVAEL